jgi:menaquinone-dependent protoporphyrinogen oxidase
MSRILVVYGTTDGHTSKIATFVATTLRSRGVVVDLFEASQAPAPGGYEAIVVAASVHAGGYQRSVAKWITDTRPALAERPTAFISVCLGVLQHQAAVDAELASIRQRFLTQTGWQPERTKIVAGALPYTHYGWLKRYVMRRIVRKAGGDTDTSRDFEYTDWDDLRTFVNEFADAHAARLAVPAVQRIQL